MTRFLGNYGSISNKLIELLEKFLGILNTFILDFEEMLSKFWIILGKFWESYFEETFLKFFNFLNLLLKKINKKILKTTLLWTSRSIWDTKENCYFGLQVSVPNPNSLCAPMLLLVHWRVVFKIFSLIFLFTYF